MIELFNNISKTVKKETEFWVEAAILFFNPLEAAQIILNYQNTLQTEEEKDFVNFYFNMRMLQLRGDNELNENNFN